jgi:hypothetical protein
VTRKLVAVAVIVALVVVGILLSMSTVLSDVFSGAGWSATPVLAAVVILAAASGYYVWAASQRQRL